MASPRIGDPSPSTAARRRLRKAGAIFGMSVVVLLLGAPVSAIPLDPCLENPTSCLPEVDPPDLPVDPPELPEELPEVPGVPDVPDVPEVPDLPSDPPDLPLDPPDDLPEVPDVDGPGGLPSPGDVVDNLPDLPGVDEPGNDNDPGASDEEGGSNDDDRGAPGGAGPGGRDGGGSGGGGGGGSDDDAAGEAAVLSATLLAEKRIWPERVERPSAGISERIRELAERLRFPLALSGAVLIFLLGQYHVDRRDPKLALAPVYTEMLGFE